MSALSPFTRARLEARFAEADRAEAERLLLETCCRRLPGVFDDDGRSLERIHCAVIELSEGRLDALKRWIAEARIDWRDVLVTAGFGDSPTAHRLPRTG